MSQIATSNVRTSQFTILLIATQAINMLAMATFRSQRTRNQYLEKKAKINQYQTMKCQLQYLYC
jgi:hypothetical protein